MKGIRIVCLMGLMWIMPGEVWAGGASASNRVEISLEGDLSEELTERLEEQVGQILETINRHERGGTWPWPGRSGQAVAAKWLQNRLDGEGYHHPVNRIRTSVHHNAEGGYSISGLVLKRERLGSVELRELKLTFDEGGNWTGGELMEEHHGIAPFIVARIPADEELAALVGETVTKLRDAYRRQDPETIRALLAADAKMIAAAERGGDTRRYRTQSGQEYLQSLMEVFALHPDIEVDFEEVDVLAHPYAEKIYGVHLRQTWNATYYRDEGYLLLIVDLSSETSPEITLRSWRPDAFEEKGYPQLKEGQVIVADLPDRVPEPVEEEPEPWGYADVSANMDSLHVNVETAGGEPVKADRFPDSEFRLELLPGDYRLLANREGYTDFRTDFRIETGETTNVPVVMEPLPVAEKESRFRRYRWYIAAGAAVLAGSSLILISSSSDDGRSAIPLPPGRP